MNSPTLSLFAGVVDFEPLFEGLIGSILVFQSNGLVCRFIILSL